MSKSSIIYILLFIFCFGNISFAQVGNPFEIKGRKEARFNNTQKKEGQENNFEIDNKDNQNQEEVINPFDIGKKKKNKISKQKISEKTKQKSQNQVLKKYLQTGDSGFLLWVFLFVLVFIAILLSINRALILKIIKSIWYYNLTNILLRNFVSREYIFYLFLFINFIINFTVFIYLSATRLFDISGFDLFKLLLLSIFVIYILKHFFIYIFKSIFPALKSLVTYNFTVLLFNISLGLILLPINLIIAYSFESLSIIFVYFSIVIIVIYYFLRLFRGFLITYNYFHISIIHFFLYLCAFEILPLIVLYKIVADIL